MCFQKAAVETEATNLATNGNTAQTGGSSAQAVLVLTQTKHLLDQCSEQLLQNRASFLTPDSERGLVSIEPNEPLGHTDSVSEYCAVAQQPGETNHVEDSGHAGEDISSYPVEKGESRLKKVQVSKNKQS